MSEDGLLSAWENHSKYSMFHISPDISRDSSGSEKWYLEDSVATKFSSRDRDQMFIHVLKHGKDSFTPSLVIFTWFLLEIDFFESKNNYFEWKSGYSESKIGFFDTKTLLWLMFLEQVISLFWNLRKFWSA